MKENNLLNEKYVYVEFGAGKGLLSHLVADSNQEYNK
jgi:hypothetical protein